MHNIIDFGAVGDGVTVNTQAIQRAIDAGGTVLIPEGVFVTGTLYLKSHGGLHLAPGAVLRASTDRADYNAADYCPQNAIFEAEFMAGTHLITAVEQEDIFIEGQGTVDGFSHHWVNENCKLDVCEFYGHPPKSAERPAQMIFFAECRNVRVENVKLYNAPFWHLFFHGCEDVFVRGLLIRGEKKQWVNDGIDIDCCSRVTVSDCIIETGDDGITLRASGKRLVRKEAICEDVVISNCILTSYLDYGIRIGVGNGIIRNCLFSNVIIRDSLSGIGVTCRFSPQGNCTSVENIRFSNLSVEALRALDLKMCSFQDHPPLQVPAYIKGLHFSNSLITTCRSNYIIGFDGSRTEDIFFHNTQFFTAAEDKTNDRTICGRLDIPETEAVLYVAKASGVVLTDCRFIHGETDPLPFDYAADEISQTVFVNTAHTAK